MAVLNSSEVTFIQKLDLSKQMNTIAPVKSGKRRSAAYACGLGAPYCQSLQNEDNSPKESWLIRSSSFQISVLVHNLRLKMQGEIANKQRSLRSPNFDCLCCHPRASSRLKTFERYC